MMSNRVGLVRRSLLADMIAASILSTMRQHPTVRLGAITLQVGEDRSQMQSPMPPPQYIEAKCEGKIDDCSICLNKIDIDEDIIILPCCHRYHKSCILQWFNQQNTCPICREKC